MVRSEPKTIVLVGEAMGGKRIEKEIRRCARCGIEFEAVWDYLCKKCDVYVESGRRQWHLSLVRGAVAKALKDGRLVRPKVCSRCGKEGRIVGHHPNYWNPFDVEWICAKCHAKGHCEERRRQAAKRIRGELR